MIEFKKAVSMSYHAYLKTDHWQFIRQSKLASVDYCCEVCGEKERLHVHHITYRNLGNEKLSDLQVLCAHHHLFAHEKANGFPKRLKPKYIIKNKKKKKKDKVGCNIEKLLQKENKRLYEELKKRQGRNKKKKKQKRLFIDHRDV